MEQTVPPTAPDRPTGGDGGPYLPDDELAALQAWWRAANYLSVGQIYLMGNALLREPLTAEHTKPRLLGHWGTTPGLTFVHAHLNRAILARDLQVLDITGPGHGGPGMVAAAWLDGTYSEVYPDVSYDEAGIGRLFTQFSFPGGIPSHVAPETPGPIHEGGELGYAPAAAGSRSSAPATTRSRCTTTSPAPWTAAWTRSPGSSARPGRRVAPNDPAGR